MTGDEKTFGTYAVQCRSAEDLLHAFRADDADAIERVRQRLPHVRHLSPSDLLDFPLTLSGAQTVIAREFGLKSWGELRLAIKLRQHQFGDALDQFKQLVYAGDAAGLDALLSAHPELRDTLDDPHFDFGSTALIIAKQNLEIVDLLIRHGADINAKSQWWAGDFHILEVTPPEIAEALVERGARVTVHAAAEQGWLDWLRRACADDPAIVNRRGGDGKTALHYASDPAVIDWLLERGADLETRDFDHQGSPLQWMIAEQKHDAARHLISRGAQVDIFAAVVLGDIGLVKSALGAHPHAIRARVNDDGYELTPTADGAHEYVYAFSGAGLSPHQVALLYDHVEVYAYLVEQSPPDVQLLAYCAAADADAARGMVAAYPDLVAGMTDADQRQLLHAARASQVEIVRLMIELGFDLRVRDDDAMTPLHWAAFHGCADVVAVLLDADDEPPLDWLNNYGGTPLTTCLYGSRHSWRGDGDHAASLTRLVAAGAEVKAEWLPTGDDTLDQILRAGLDQGV